MSSQMGMTFLLDKLLEYVGNAGHPLLSYEARSLRSSKAVGRGHFFSTFL
jgi:hypothetical protein